MVITWYTQVITSGVLTMEKKFSLDRDSKAPIHQQLYRFIKECIDDGTFKEREAIPSEKDMQELFDVSRITVRRAISDLEHDGYLRKIRGKGTFVERIKKEKPLSSFTSFSGDAKVKGDKPGSIILACRKMEASVKVADRLQIEPGESITYLKRLRLLNGKIIALHESHISSRIGIEICEDDFDTTTSLYEYLEENGISLGSADETLEVKMASFELRRDLFLEETQPLVYKERVTYDSEGHPVEFSQNSYIAETYKYYVHIVNVKDGGNRS